jgi:hypothetical protein
LWDEAIDQISPREALNADVIEHICNLQFVCSCWARKEKQKAKNALRFIKLCGKRFAKEMQVAPLVLKNPYSTVSTSQNQI